MLGGLVIFLVAAVTGFNLLIWVIPPIGLLLGSVVLTLTVRAMRREHHGQTKEDALPQLAGLEPYLSAVDQEIHRLTKGSGRGKPHNAVEEVPDIQSFGGKVG